MQRAFLRAAVLAAGLVLIVEACGSAASPAPTQPAANVSPATASEVPASVAPSPSPASVAPSPSPASLPSPVESATPVPSVAPSPSAAAPGVAGTWNGTWQDQSPDQAGGTFVVTWTQSGNALAGKIVVKGTPCLTDGTVTGTINGSAISFGVVSGRITIAYDGSVSGSTMKGTYTAGAACGDAKGTWAATK